MEYGRQQPPTTSGGPSLSQQHQGYATMMGHASSGPYATGDDDVDGYEMERTAMAALQEIEEGSQMGSRWSAAAHQFDMNPKSPMGYDMHQYSPRPLLSPAPPRTPQPQQQQQQHVHSKPGSPMRLSRQPINDAVLSGIAVERNDYREAAEFFWHCKGGNKATALDFVRGVLVVMMAADSSSIVPPESHNWDRAVRNGPPYITAEDQAAAQVQLVMDQQDSILHQAQRLGIAPKPPPIEPLNLFRDEIDERISTLVVLVPGRAHIIGHLIGKGGAEVGKIERELSVTIKIEPASKMGLPLAERSVCIIGHVASTTQAQQQVSHKVHEKLLSEGVQAEVLKMVVPNEIVRHLIGKNGANINRLQSESGARIQVEPESTMMPGSVGRTIVLQGSERCRTFAQYLILRQIAEDRNVHSEWAGRVHGANGSGSPAAATAGGALSPQQSPAVASLGYPGGGAAAAPGLALQNPTHAQPVAHASLPSPAGQMGRSQRAGNASSSQAGAPAVMAAGGEPQEVIVLTVPEQAVALLIGRNGSSVLDIQNQTGARVNIARGQPGQSTEEGRRVTVSGTPKAVEVAQHLIRARVQAALSAALQHHNNNQHGSSSSYQQGGGPGGGGINGGSHHHQHQHQHHQQQQAHQHQQQQQQQPGSGAASGYSGGGGGLGSAGTGNSAYY